MNSSAFEYAARVFENTLPHLGRPPLEPHQVPPEGEWKLWLLEAGRGSGKTEACSRYYSKYMQDNPGSRGRIIAPTFGDAVESCIEGPSGLKAVDPQVVFHATAAGGAKVRWPNGSEALVIGTHSNRDVERLRAGGNRHIDWWEEMAANSQLDDAWAQAQFGLRLGHHPHSVASTTPKVTPAYRKIRSLTGTVLSTATMYDNPYNPAEWISHMEEIYAGTRIGRQELEGMLLEDVENAMWTLALVDAALRQHPTPELVQKVTAVDASGSSDGDATGIVTAGVDKNGVVYILSDDTTHGTPEFRYEAVCKAAYRENVGTLYYEGAYGGDNVAANIRSAWEHLRRTGDIDTMCPRIKRTEEKGGKADRAAPVAGLFEQHASGTERVWFDRPMPDLADQMCTWEPDSKWSPDRMDAMVYAVRFLTSGLGRESEGTWGGAEMAAASVL